jgi:hypothetical protein
MEIIIALDSYDDLFSDFDIRGFDQRPFSRDFLDELNLRMIKIDEDENLKIILILPQKLRNLENENTILERLTIFFEGRYKSYCKKNNRIIIRSIIYVGIGILLLIFANILSKKLPQMFNDFLLIPSWYFTWDGLQKFIDSRSEMRRKIKYYNMLMKSELVFGDIDA